MLKIKTTCPICNEVHYVMVDEIGFMRWQEEGEPIQFALPELSADDREMLLSGICPTCWDKMFGVDNDDPECDCEFITEEDEESEPIEPVIVELMNIHSEFTRLIEEVEKDFIGSELEEGYMNGLERAKEVVEERIWTLENKLISQ